MSTASQFKPYKRKSKKTIAKEKRAKALNKRTASLTATYRTFVTTSLCRQLYKKAFAYWKKELVTLSEKNALAHGLNPKDYSAIYFNCRQYYPENFDLSHASVEPYDSDSVYCLNIHDRYQERMAEIAEALDEIKDEHYEVSRFILNFLSINPPIEHYERIFGPQLFPFIEKPVQEYAAVDWDENQEVELVTYVRGNKDTILKMQERIIQNLVL